MFCGHDRILEHSLKFSNPVFVLVLMMLRLAVFGIFRKIPLLLRFLDSISYFVASLGLSLFEFCVKLSQAFFGKNLCHDFMIISKCNTFFPFFKTHLLSRRKEMFQSSSIVPK